MVDKPLGEGYSLLYFANPVIRSVLSLELVLRGKLLVASILRNFDSFSQRDDNEDKSQ